MPSATFIRVLERIYHLFPETSEEKILYKPLISFEYENWLGSHHATVFVIGDKYYGWVAENRKLSFPWPYPMSSMAEDFQAIFYKDILPRLNMFAVIDI